MQSKYFSIVKCDSKTSRKIQLYTLALMIFGYLLIKFSPFAYFFHMIGYEKSNGCPLYTLAGIPCPTCGLGRGLSVILDLHFDRWLYYNPSAPFLFIPLFIIILLILALTFYNYRIIINKEIYKLWYVAIIVTSAIWILNIFLGHIER